MVKLGSIQKLRYKCFWVLFGVQFFWKCKGANSNYVLSCTLVFNLMMRVQFNKLKAARSIIFQRVQPDIQDMHILQLFRTIFQTFFLLTKAQVHSKNLENKENCKDNRIKRSIWRIHVTFLPWSLHYCTHSFSKNSDWHLVILKELWPFLDF